MAKMVETKLTERNRKKMDMGESGMVVLELRAGLLILLLVMGGNV
jgi:hypothetical protein